jgi:hypothetical protein
MPLSRWRGAAVLLAALGLYAATTHARVFAAGNDASRWAQIEALVDLGSPTIERSRFRGTVDKVIVDGREYSNKPPFFSLLGAALYAPLAKVTNWRLGDAATSGRAIWTLTLLLVGLPAAAGVAIFDRELASDARLSAAGRGLLASGLAAGTLFFSFAGTLNNHVPAAVLLLAAAVTARHGRPLASGLAAGFAAAIDLLPGLGLAPFLAWGASRGGSTRSRELARFALGFTPGVVAFALSNLAITGTLLPPKMLPGAVDLSAQAGPSAAGVVLPQSARYPVEVLFGAHGLFTVSPLLLLGAAGLVFAMRREPGDERRFWRALAAGVALQIVGHALLAGSYGGWSYGYRYLIPIQPLLLLAAPFALGTSRRTALGAALLAPSLLLAALGAFHPWPPAYEQATSGAPVAMQVTNPIGGNAAAFAAARAPDSRLAEQLGAAFVSRDPELRRRYFALFFASKGDLETLQRFAAPRP